MCKLLYFFLTLLLLISESGKISAQTWRIQLQANDTVYSQKVPGLKETHQQAAEAVQEIENWIAAWHRQGHLAASVDSVRLQDSVYMVWYFAGPKFTSGHLDLSLLPKELWQNNLVDTGTQMTSWNGKEMSTLKKRIVTWYENHGYPFAQVKLDALVFKPDGAIDAALSVEKGRMRRLDSIAILGEVGIDRRYLLKYLNLENGELYNEAKLGQLAFRLAELPHLQESQPWEIAFEAYTTRLSLYLIEKRANQLNALIGLQPNTQATGKFLLTVDAQFAFRNVLGYGEYFSLNYQNLQYRSPHITLEGYWPYLLGSDLGVDAQFELYRNDLLFRKSGYKAGVRYYLNAHNYLRFFYQNQSNKLLQIDTFLLSQSYQLPTNADFQSNGVGVEAAFQKTDYRLNPRKGWQMSVSVAGLKRKVLPNDEILRLSTANENFQALYDSANASPYQLLTTAQLAHYLPMGKTMTLKTAYEGGYLLGKKYFRNELFQVGGSQLLRGFDERSLFVNHYQIFTAEVRVYTAANSFFQVFTDQGFLQSSYSGSILSGYHYGLGGGLVVENKNGLFQVTYALGSSPNNPLSFRQSKIHFGYLVLF